MSWKGYRFIQYVANFGGLNTYQSPDLVAQGQGREAMIETPDELNFYSWPSGSMAKLFGHANLNTTQIYVHIGRQNARKVMEQTSL